MEATQTVARGVVLLRFSGRFDAYQAPTVRRWLSDAELTSSRIVIDLSEVSFLDSSGLSLLVQQMKACRAAGGDLRLSGLQPPVRLIFELTRLERTFAIFASAPKAVASFR